MQPDWLTQRRERERNEIAERKRRDAENEDPELVQCVIAYHAFRVDGGQMKFEDFRRQWYLAKGGRDWQVIG